MVLIQERFQRVIYLTLAACYGANNNYPKIIFFKHQFGVWNTNFEIIVLFLNVLRLINLSLFILKLSAVFVKEV